MANHEGLNENEVRRIIQEEMNISRSRRPTPMYSRIQQSINSTAAAVLKESSDFAAERTAERTAADRHRGRFAGGSRHLSSSSTSEANNILSVLSDSAILLYTFIPLYFS